MIIVVTSRKGRVYEVINDDNYSKVLDKLNWLIENMESLGYFLVKESSHCFEFYNNYGWKYGIMLADGWVSSITTKQ